LEDNDNPLVNVNGGELVMKSGKITGNTHIGDGWVNCGGVRVVKGTFTMTGGVISGNSASYGGGVNVTDGDTFTLEGGRIQDGTDSDGFTKNTTSNTRVNDAVLNKHENTANWGTGGTYTKGGVS
jgi:hypothetical protein